MPDWRQDLLDRHSANGLLVDANILLVRAVGRYRSDFITKFKRTSGYTIDDFKTLERFSARFRTAYTTPHVLTEVSNLCGQFPSAYRPAILQGLLRIIVVLEERFTPSAALANHPAYLRFGLSDTAIVELATTGLLVLTDDFRLSQYLQSVGAQVINFNHLRPIE